jgi:hypothetical protein
MAIELSSRNRYEYEIETTMEGGVVSEKRPLTPKEVSAIKDFLDNSPIQYVFDLFKYITKVKFNNESCAAIEFEYVPKSNKAIKNGYRMIYIAGFLERK